MKMLEDLEEVVRLSDRATPGTVELHTSCSWRRIVSGNRPFLVPTVDPDGHANMDTTESAEFVVSLVNWFRTHHATIRDMAARLEAAERDAEKWRAIEPKREEGVKYGCHVDLEPGMEPDGCVIDEGEPHMCMYAKNIACKELCPYWRKVQPAGQAMQENGR